MPNALAVVLRGAPLTSDKIAFAWLIAVGPAVGRATTAELKGRVLHVRAKDAAWRREVERSTGVIRTRLQALLGDDVVHGIEVAVP